MISTLSLYSGVIVFASDQEVAGVMEAVHRLRVFDHFIWIGSDGWSARAVVSQGRERAVEGTLSLQPRAGKVKGFEQYFLALRPSTNLRNPWFVEYWETVFQCKFASSPLTPANLRHTSYANQLPPEYLLITSDSIGNASNDHESARQCTGHENYSVEHPYERERQLQFVSDAVLTFAYALKQMHQVECGGRAGLCDRMRPINGARLLPYLRKVRFVGLSGDSFQFTDTQDGPVRYDVLQYRRSADGRYQWTLVGSYEDQRLQLNVPLLRFPGGNTLPVGSACSQPCLRGQARRYVAGEQCCWHCLDCGPYDVIENGERCRTCDAGYVPDAQQRICRALPIEHIGYTHSIAPAALAVAAVGLACSGAVAGVLYRHRETPLVRASGRELSAVQLIAIAALFAYPLLALLPPSVFVCAMQRVHLTLSLATLYAALLTKTNRISRVFRASARSARPPPLISPQAQLCICGALVAAQAMITLIWLTVQPPQVLHHYPTRETHQVTCALQLNHFFLLVLAYPAILVLVCTYQAFLTRKTPEAFNESKFIGFTMYATCVIWLAFLPIFTVIRQTLALNVLTVSCSVCGSAFAALLLLFAPKLYIILLHPEKNVRSHVKPFAGKLKTSQYQNPSQPNFSVAGDRNNNLSSPLGGAAGESIVLSASVCKCTEIEMNERQSETASQKDRQRTWTAVATQTSPTLATTRVRSIVHSTSAFVLSETLVNDTSKGGQTEQTSFIQRNGSFNSSLRRNTNAKNEDF